MNNSKYADNYLSYKLKTALEFVLTCCRWWYLALTDPPVLYTSPFKLHCPSPPKKKFISKRTTRLRLHSLLPVIYQQRWLRNYQQRWLHIYQQRRLNKMKPMQCPLETSSGFMQVMQKKKEFKPLMPGSCFPFILLYITEGRLLSSTGS